jgi:hypothetical protein
MTAAGGGHGAGHAHLDLAIHLGAADGSVLLVTNTDGRGREQEIDHACIRGPGTKRMPLAPSAPWPSVSANH